MADVEAQPYQPMHEGGTAFVKHANREVRLGFIRKVYGILTAQLLLTVLVAAPMQQLPKAWFVHNIWLLQASLLCSLIAVLAISCCRNIGKSFPTNYLVLLGFTVSEAVLVGVVSARYTSGTVCLCAALTTAIFLGMTAFAWTTKSDFTGAGPYLFAGLLSLFVFGCATFFMQSAGMHVLMMTKLYAAGGILLFTMYIVYDTQLIIGEFKGHKISFDVDEYVFAALNLYLDIVNLFLDLLRLLGNQR
mmetsp:Transcript_21249/g.49478  ORF Transcript_21249/g.49478 Transcript_21249/m.49478 type:complete len:247 (-) Transcript_21249:93-833(-)|eukprot:CAMPEP_0171096732 /NCGR_PEP_ID=MMETSP0766_2-20121228/45741_1 /TAXON_ID=439317 /ORGANISM="Gambierdiscus australes, Strain CAWD 149" /LENGTH=246 /DNA_ID=CAMNT_0011555783 /DNA_START=84 /DNA_END=824 /DNA_ORIENTATION=-